MNVGWAVAGHVLLAPMLALSQQPWSGLFMLLIRVALGMLFILVLIAVVLMWQRRRNAGVRDIHYFRDWVIPLLLAGLGLALLCSQDRGSVDHLFQRMDNMLMNGHLMGSQPVFRPGSWHDVLPGEDVTRDVKLDDAPEVEEVAGAQRQE